MSERRHVGRIDVKTRCTLSLGSRRIPAEVINLSDQGVLLGFEKGSGAVVPDEELGAEASFVLTTFTPHRLYTGEIIRSFFSEEAQRVALRFWKKYTPVSP